MDWKQRSEMIHSITKLGRRESQVLALKEEGYSPEEMKQEFTNSEGDSPQANTLRSILSQLSDKQLRSSYTTDIIGRSVDYVQVPSLTELETEQDTVRVIAGKIGSGKTVSNLIQSADLDTNDAVDSIQILDPLSEWKEHLTDIEKASVTEFSNVPDSVKEKMKNEVLEYIDSIKEDSLHVIYIDQAHYISRDSEICNSIQSAMKDSPGTISLRLITHTPEDVCEDLTVDIYNIFRLPAEDFDGILQDHEFTINPESLHIGMSAEPFSNLIHYNVAKDTVKLKCSYLTEEKRELLNMCD